MVESSFLSEQPAKGCQSESTDSIVSMRKDSQVGEAVKRTRGLQDDPNHNKRYNAPPCPVTNCIIPTSTCDTRTCRSALYLLKLAHCIVSLISGDLEAIRHMTCVKVRMTRLEKILSEGTLFGWSYLMCLNTPFTHG